MSDQLSRMGEDQRAANATEVLPPISEEEQSRIVKKLRFEVQTFNSAVGELHKKLTRWHELYEAQPKGKKVWPWPGASNYVVPLVMSTIDSVHARIMKSVFEVDPIWLAKPRTPGSVEAAKKAEWYLDMWADLMRLARTVDGVSLNMLIEGTGIIKADWVKRTRAIPQQSTGFQVGQAQTSLPTQVVEYDGPRGYNVPLKDFVLIPADAPTLEDAVYAGHRVYLTTQQLEERRKSGLYFNVDKLLALAPTTAAEKAPHPSGLVAATTGTGAYPETRQYEVYELYGPYDFGDGPVPALFTLNVEHGILLRLEPYPYQYGRAPYVDFCIFPRTNFFWGRSLAEMLESPQEELTALHNMRADAIARRIAPPLLRRFGSRWDAEKQPWKPGQVIDVNDPAEIIELAMADVPSSMFAHEQDTMAFVERMTGMSDVFMGRTGSPYTSATATSKAHSEGLVRMDISISRFQESMQTLAWIVWWMLYQYRPYVDTFQAGEQAMAITKQEMAPGLNGLMPFEFVPQGMLSDATKENRRQQLIFLLNTASGPLSQFYPDGIQKLLDEVFAAFDIQNRATMLGPSWNLLQQQLQQAAQQGYQEGVKAAQQAAPQ